MTRFFVLAGLLSLASSPSLALSVGKSNADTAPASTSISTSAPSSLMTMLSLEAGQARQLDRLYEGYAARRLEQESKIARWQGEVDRAQLPASFDERKASRLLREISGAQSVIETSLLSTRAQALKALAPAQRRQLQALASRPQTAMRRDRYFQLLLMPVDSMEALPLARDTRTEEVYERANPNGNANRTRRRRGVASYGAYGGYGYGGPQYGVGAHYGRGPIGVHAGVGRGGPSVGVSIGGILGRGW